MENYAIEMLNITKRFPGIVANDDITLQVKYGEIHALLGENGAGKSTLMSVLFGLYKPEEGRILLDGKEVKITSPRKANELGIGMVHQHFMQIKNFTVLENIILGVETTKNGVLQMQEARQKVVELSERYGLKVDPDALVRDITVGQQQRVEILKMLYRDCKILIFDEPTAVLTPQEIEELMGIMRNLKNEGKAIIFITHKLDEIKAVSDKCTVLRLGKCIGTVNTADATTHQMAEMMVGREVNFHVDKAPQKLGEPVLSLKNIYLKSEVADKYVLNNISFDVHSGEILCIAGVEGNGQSEIVKVISGLMQQESGTIILNGKDISNESRRQRIIDGLSYVPEDRHKHGVILDSTLEENLALKKYFLPEYQNKGIINFKSRRELADKLISEFDIRSSEGRETITRSMSGGNQQKAIVAREIDAKHDVLVAIQPTRGLDVGAIEGIHANLVAQRDEGKAVLLVSFDLEEVMGVSDRIIVFYEGEVVANVRPEDVTINELGLYMSGSKKGENLC
ncbi:MAG: ABC transporter ATP-binding protein [Erysipelotrichaceae bacterium]|nr:ABC transporter ATP-binding protein [Erysipelotrichaceae bacterium]